MTTRTGTRKVAIAPTAEAAGVLPAHALAAMIERGEIASAESVAPEQIQPASLDLRLGRTAYRLRASFLPGRGARVEKRLASLAMHEIDITKGAVLETGCVYLVPLLESLRLPSAVAGLANPKSSTGRIDVFTRLLIDGADEFDRVPAGYEGPLYAEISPRTFSILVRTGSRLNQLRLKRGSPGLADAELKHLQTQERLIADEASDIAAGIALRADLKGDASGLVGWRAKRHAGLIDVDKAGAYDPADYWDAVYARGAPEIILDPNEFYILASKESVHVPPAYAAEMVPYDPLVGEFRVHYAGFFDPGFGHAAAGGAGSKAVLEVRSHEVPFVLADGQKVGRLVYERLTESPRELYGQRKGSHYQAQGLQLSKHFRRPV
ncbi:MAG: 2'-deoxycytidine 5'-triphosphate deaminase [Alphaproteobacteria bacterium]